MSDPHPRAPVNGSLSASLPVGPFLRTRRGLCAHFVGKETEKLPHLCPLRDVTVSLVARKPGKQGSEGSQGQDLGPGWRSGLGWGQGGQGMPNRAEISGVLGTPLAPQSEMPPGRSPGRAWLSMAEGRPLGAPEPVCEVPWTARLGIDSLGPTH